MALRKKKPRELSIKEKIMVIQKKESEGKSQRELAMIFGVSKTQIQNTLQRKADVLAAYDDNLPNDRKRVRIFQFEEDIVVTLTTRTKAEFFFGPWQIKLLEKNELNVKEEKGRKNGLQPCSVYTWVENLRKL